ncbi:MAG: NAD/NADP octopine/nopaline dehydrogenase family protein [Candidatus Thorarchaeota archaeon]
MSKLKIDSVAVLGGGHAGRGLASYLSLQGFDVSLYNRTRSNIKAIIDSKGLEVYGVVEGFAHLSLITTNIRKAMENRDILIVTVPAQAHTFFAKKMAPHLQEGQLVLLMPGRTGGALEFAQLIGRSRDLSEIMLGEAQTFSFVSRITGSNSVTISKIKNRVQVSALPATDNQEFLSRLGKLPIFFTTSANVLETSLNNVGAMLHPTPTILCTGIIESKKVGYNHYLEGISESVGRLIEKMDAERVAIARAFSLNPVSLLKWLTDAYDASGKTLYESIRSIDAYDKVGNPDSLEHRYMLEDIPTGLVPMSRLASLCNIQTPTIDSVVTIASQLCDRDFWSEGRNLRGMGIADMSPSEVITFVESSERVPEYLTEEEHRDFYVMEWDET